MVHELFGLDGVMRGHADRLAAAGYLTVAVDLFGSGRCLFATMKALRTGEGKAFADIRAARGWLAASPGCTGRVGVLGFCMGGGFALMTVGDFDVCAVNYGQLPRALDGTLAGGCPVVASYGARDPTLRGAAARLTAALERAGAVHDVKEYPDAGHAFLNDGPAGPRALRPLQWLTQMGPEPRAASDAWQRIIAFFATHLVP
jgi:carboxymethylenebutenolidase